MSAASEWRPSGGQRSTVTVLLLEDSAPDAQLLEAQLEAGGVNAEVTRVDTRERFLTALGHGAWDIVLADYRVPGFDGREALALARDRAPSTPFLFVSGALGEDVAIELLKLGATDYVLKDRLERLVPSVERALREAREKVERRRAEDALKESERMLTTLMNNMPGMAFRCQAKPPFSFDYASYGVQDLTGYSAEAFRAGGTARWESLIHPEDRPDYVRAFEGARQGEQQTSRYRIRTRHGETRWVWDRSNGILGDDGALQFVEGFVTDITAQVEAELETKKRTDFEQQLIGIVSHDLRNPLNVIALATATTLMREDLPEQAARSLLRIRSATDRAARMIRDLLDFTQARLGGGILIERKRADLRSIVYGVVDEAETTHPGRRVKIEHAGSSDGHFDPDRLSQALANLVVNALRHSPSSGDVTVRLRGEGDDRVVIEIHNFGPPIPEDLRNRLFQPMQRGSARFDRETRSVGLGLYIVDNIVRGHGGQVTVTSSADDGTVFRLELPRFGPLAVRDSLSGIF